MRIFIALISLVWLTLAVNAEVLDGAVCSAADKSGTISTPCTGTVLIGGINTEGAYTRQASIQTLISVAGASTVTATLAIPLTSYVDQSFNVKFLSDSTGPMTLAISGLPAKPIVTAAGVAIATGDIRAANLYIIRYFPANDQFRVLNAVSAGGGGTALSEQVLTVTSGTAAWDMSAGADALLNVTATTTLANPTYQTLFARGVLRIKQGAVGGFALSLGTSYVVINDTISLINTAPFTQTEYNYHIIASSGVGSIELTPRNKGVRQSAVLSTASGTNIDFPVVPAWAKRITISFRSVRNNGGYLMIQLGSGSIQTSGYVGGAFAYNSGSASSSTTGFVLDQSAPAANDRDGVITLVNVGNNAWAASGTLYVPNVTPSSGGVTLVGAISNVRVTSLGAAAFSAGSVSALFE